MRSLRFLFLLICITIFLPSVPSEASCVYNKSKYNVNVTFNCGLSCWNNWNLDPGDHKCRPGASGNVTVWYKSWSPTPASSVMRKVSSHGWVDINNSDVCSYDDKGKLKGCDDRW